MAKVGKEAYNEIVGIIQNLEEDIVKFYDKEVNAAGGRLRKGLAAISETIRAEKKNVLEVRNTRVKK